MNNEQYEFRFPELPPIPQDAVPFVFDANDIEMDFEELMREGFPFFERDDLIPEEDFGNFDVALDVMNDPNNEDDWFPAGPPPQLVRQVAMPELDFNDDEPIGMAREEHPNDEPRPEDDVLDEQEINILIMQLPQININ